MNLEEVKNEVCIKPHCTEHGSKYKSRCCWFCQKAGTCETICKLCKPGALCNYIVTENYKVLNEQYGKFIKNHKQPKRQKKEKAKCK